MDNEALMNAPPTPLAPAGPDATRPAPTQDRAWKACIPTPVKRLLRFAWEYPGYRYRLARNLAYDRRRFMKWSSAKGRPRGRRQLQAWITADYHKIEKALALKSPRPGFGAAVVQRLLENLRLFHALYGVDETWRTGVRVLQVYLDFHVSRGRPLPGLEGEVTALRQLDPRRDASAAEGGVLRVTRRSIHERGCLDLSGFFASRHSVRHFGTDPVPRDRIVDAVRMAQKTPTVCNRQAPRVHAYLEPRDRRRVLECHQGNAGFGDQAGAVLAVTVDLRAFFAVGERNQAWIDGGLFAMSLVYALHSLGLGTCCLNWSVEQQRDQALRKVTGIPASESVVMLIAVGTLPESFLVARSPRTPLEDVLTWGHTHDPDATSPATRRDSGVNP